MFSTVLAAYVVQVVQYCHDCLSGARTTESWLHGRYCTDLSWLPFERQGQDFHGCHFGYWYSSVMEAYEYCSITVMAVSAACASAMYSTISTVSIMAAYMGIGYWYSSTVTAASAGQVYRYEYSTIMAACGLGIGHCLTCFLSVSDSCYKYLA